MKILLLPGASDSNREWADMWAHALSEQGHEVKEFYYDHWGKEQMISLEGEAKKLSELDRSWTQGCVIVAKSIGTVLCLFAVTKKILLPSGAIFMGFPSGLDGEKDASMPLDIRGWLSQYSVPTVIFQNENDPVTSYEDMKKFVQTNTAITTISLPGDTHKYTPDAYLTRVLGYIDGKK